MRLAVISILVGLALTASGQEASATKRFTQQVANLGHDDFRVRERAHKELRQAGEKAREALEDAAENSTDAEVRERASMLLRRLGAGPRIAEAIKQLNGQDWDKVKAALLTLCDEYGEETGVEEAVKKAAGGKNQAAKMAGILQQQWKNYQRQQQHFMRNTSFQHAQYVQQFYANYRRNMKRSVEYMCKREFDKQQAKRKKEQKK
jgi:hypothetical protein